MTIRTYIFKYFLLLGIVIFGANGVYNATNIENPILNVTYTLAMVAATVAAGIYINNIFKTAK